MIAIMPNRYTPEERAERRRRSSERRFTTRPLLDPDDVSLSDDGESDEASWIKDLRSQGVDVDDFLKAAFPPDTIDVASGEEEIGRVESSDRRFSNLSTSSQIVNHRVVYVLLDGYQWPSVVL